MNPFQPPETDTRNAARRKIDLVPFLHWPLVFGMNMVVPTIVGWGISEDAGRQGIALGCLLMLLLGWVLCYVSTAAAKRLIFGSLVLTFTQLFPVIQIGVGALGILLASAVAGRRRQPADDNQPPDDGLHSELEGFIVTFFVGATLIICAGVLGFLVALISPRTVAENDEL